MSYLDNKPIRLSELNNKPPSPSSVNASELSKQRTKLKQQQQRQKQQNLVETKKQIQQRNKKAGLTGAAQAAARVRRKRRKEKADKNHEVDMLVTLIPEAVDATHILRLLSPRLAPKYVFDKVLVDKEDQAHARHLTSYNHKLF